MQNIKQKLLFFYRYRLKHLDAIDEKISLKQQEFIKNYDQSLRLKRIFNYSSAFLKSAITILFVISGSQFITDYIHGQDRPMDIIVNMISCSNDLDERTYYAFDEILTRGRNMKELDSLSYCTIGHLFSQISQPDLAQTAYYLALLKDRDSDIGANSDLKFETVTKGQQE